MNKLLAPFKEADKFILAIVIFLGIISLTMLESTVYDGGFVMSRVVLIQLIAYLLGFAMIIAVQFFNYQFFDGLGKYLYIIGILVLLSVYIPGLGLTLYGSRAWINLGFTTLQPSEFVKIIFALVNAEYLEKHQDELDTFLGFVKAGLYSAPMIVIVLKEDLGSALVYIVMWLFMVFYAGVKIKVFLESCLIVLLSIPIVYKLLDDYQKERIEAFLHPDNLSLSGNYQVWQSKVAMGSGGFFGKGLFNGTQKTLDFIPVQQSDFIFSVIVEELGFLGGAFVILLYAMLLTRFARTVERCDNLYGALIVIGFLGMFLFQIFENIAMTMGMMPVTGITLPFLSGGGTSVIASLIAVGVVLNIGINSKKTTF